MAVLIAPQAAKVALRDRLQPQEWKRLGSMFGFIALLHVVGGTLLILGSQGHYHVDAKTTFGIGTGFLAYTLGMRHAFDADHISAIDNTTRKLMSEGKRPLGVGFFFSLGHSSVVFLLTVILGLGAKALGSQVRNHDSSLHHYTSLVGTTVSGGFLLLIAILNVIVLVSIVKVFRNLKKSHYDDAELEKQLNSRGLLNRFFGPLARSVDSSWKMYPIGFLFGLGFDTATEVALLVLAGSSVASGLPFWAILSLPLLFAAGMSTLDTIDGSFMNFAYGWAFAKPVRKVFYNITITSLSVAVALIIGTIELIGVLVDQANIKSGPLVAIADIPLDYAGYGIVALFVVTWLVALAVWKFGRIEEKWTAALAKAAR